MSPLKILHVDENHPLMLERLERLGYHNDLAYTTPLEEILKTINTYDGMVIRSRFPIDKKFIDTAQNLRFIARVGAGLENIDVKYAQSKNIHLIAAPEGNRNAVSEHALGMLLSLFNNLNKADKEVRKGLWLREENRGEEVDGKTIGLIGYGNMGKAFAKKLRGFDVTVLCCDIKPNVGDENATQVSLEELQKKSDILSLHVPETKLTHGMIDGAFINNFNRPFWLINTARGKNIVTKDLVMALKSGKILGAALDVLEYEKSSFENLFTSHHFPAEFDYLITSDNTILSPHVAGWTLESNVKLAQTIADKVLEKFS